ncbi:MAG: hydroxyacid dehydrogenase [Oribacterium sp.]|nr:hydroxyacid dehydrogenase [Oribacterium sp.]
MEVYIPQNIAQAGKDYLTQKGYAIRIGTGSDEETMLREIGRADALLVRTAKITAKLMAADSNLKVIGRHGVGTDNIDLDYCRTHGIRVTNGPLSNTESVAEHTVAFILALAYHVLTCDDEVRKGNWDYRSHVNHVELYGKTVGIVGYGRIGSSVGKMLHDAFDMKVIGYSRHITQDSVPNYVEATRDLTYLLQNSDFVSLHVPGGKHTENLIGRKELSLMKPSAFLINCDRGSVVDERALHDTLAARNIAGAALDCLKDEPDPSPLLYDLPNIIFSPHCSAHTKESFDRMAVHAAQGIDDVLSGRRPEWAVV